MAVKKYPNIVKDPLNPDRVQSYSPTQTTEKTPTQTTTINQDFGSKDNPIFNEFRNNPFAAGNGINYSPANKTGNPELDKYIENDLSNQRQQMGLPADYDVGQNYLAGLPQNLTPEQIQQAQMQEQAQLTKPKDITFQNGLLGGKATAQKIGSDYFVNGKKLTRQQAVQFGLEKETPQEADTRLKAAAVALGIGVAAVGGFALAAGGAVGATSAGTSLAGATEATSLTGIAANTISKTGILSKIVSSKFLKYGLAATIGTTSITGAIKEFSRANDADNVLTTSVASANLIVEGVKTGSMNISEAIILMQDIQEQINLTQRSIKALPFLTGDRKTNLLMQAEKAQINMQIQRTLLLKLLGGQ